MYDLGNQFKINKDNLKVNEKAIIIGQKFRIQILTERFFPWSEYTSKKTNFPKKIKTGLIFTMGATAELAKQFKMDDLFQRSAMMFSLIFGSQPEILASYNTLYLDPFFLIN